MGQTLSHGVYLPAEGERNCYSGLASNWNLLDTALGDIAGKASATHTHGNITNDGKLATADRVVITDSTKSFTTSNVTATELGYLSGVTSAIQTQLNGKAADSDVVHKSGNETIGGNKSFSDPLSFSKTTTLKGNFQIGVAPDSTFSNGFSVRDPNNNSSQDVRYIITSTGDTYTSFRACNKFSNGALSPTGSAIISELQIGVTSTGTKYIYNNAPFNNSIVPLANNTYDLGTSANKWKTLNGINPGALSLPDLSSGTGVSLSAGANSYSPPSSGWLSINLTGAISVVCGDFCHSGTDMISVPVVKGSTYTVTVATSGTAYLFVSQGNV